MKKLFTIACLMLVTVLALAQNTKKVAILEVVDREGKLSYSQKLMLRSNMAQAITNTQEYDAYDRTDMDAILSEQNFQRTGLVSEDQIKQLGIMTGAQYVLIIEAVEVESLNLYVTVKVLDVETARIEISGNEIMKNTAQDISRGCQTLAKTLFKPAVDKKKIATQRKTEAAIVTKVQWKDDKYLYENKAIGKTKAYYLVMKDIKKQPQYRELSVYKELKKSKQTITAGWILLGIGVPTIMPGVLERLRVNNYLNGMMDRKTSFTFIGCGAGMILTSIPCLAIGYAKRNRTVKSIVSTTPVTPISFNLTAGQNGIGLAMHF